MPSTSPKQARLMAAVAHGWHKPGGGGPPVSVAKEFNQADKGSGMARSKSYGAFNASYAAGGPVLGKYSPFMKTQDEFRDPDEGKMGDSADEDQKYGKSGEGKGSGFTKPPKATGKTLKTVKPRG